MSEQEGVTNEQKEAEEAAAQAEQAAQPPQPPEPTQEQIDVQCGNCKRQFSFPVEGHILSFSFDCTECQAHNEWTRT